MVQSSYVVRARQALTTVRAGQHRHRYYSSSTKVPSTNAVIGVSGVFWAQRILTKLLVWTKGLAVDGYGSGPKANRCLTVLSSELMG